MKDETHHEEELLRRITVDAKIFCGKPILRGRRLAVEHVLGMLAAGDRPETILAAYPWLEPEDIQACLVYAMRLVGYERVEPALGGHATWRSSWTPASQQRPSGTRRSRSRCRLGSGLAHGPRRHRDPLAVGIVTRSLLLHRRIAGGVTRR